MSDKENKVGKKHDKKNCQYCKNHKKHPNVCDVKKQNEKSEVKADKKESVGLVPKMVKIARGILFDVCAHAHDGDKFGYYEADLTHGKWNHLVVNGKNDEKDAERKADVIWSYDEGKFVKDKNGVMEIATLFNEDAERIQSRFEKKPCEKCENVERGDDDGKGKHKEYDRETKDDNEDDAVVCRVQSCTIDTRNGTFKDNITGVVKKVDEMTDEERELVEHFVGKNPTAEKPTVEKPSADKPKDEKPSQDKDCEVHSEKGCVDIMDKAIEIAHRLKDERDEALANLKAMRLAYEGIKASITAQQKAAELRKFIGEDDERKGFFVKMLKRFFFFFGIGALGGIVVSCIIKLVTRL